MPTSFMEQWGLRFFILGTLLWATVFEALKAEDLSADIKRIPVVFTGGHETDPVDGGRPVVLIAAALGVPAEVFREAFSHVRPARRGEAPEPAQVLENKKALMSTLAKYGVDNERLDQVSNYYRYVKSRDELWTIKPAMANALVKDGVVIGYEIISGGAGYSSVPIVTVPGLKEAKSLVVLSFGKSLETNGSIAAIRVR